MDLKIEKITVGEIDTNCYFVSNKNKEVFVVDPGDEAAKIIEKLEQEKLSLKYILITHGHWDHVLACEDLKIKYPKSDIVVGVRDAILMEKLQEQEPYAPGTLHNITTPLVRVAEGSTLILGEYLIRVFETPGHTPGGVTYFIEGNLFTGDTIFYHTYGRVDLPGGNYNQIAKSLNRLLKLPAPIKIFPGHGKETTVGEEKSFWTKNR